MSDSAEILIFTQSNALQRIVQLSDAFRQVCSAEQGQIFSLGSVYIQSLKHSYVLIRLSINQFFFILEEMSLTIPAKLIFFTILKLSSF